MAGRLLRWCSYACLIGCGLLAASACLDPKTDDLPARVSQPDDADFAPDGEQSENGRPLTPGDPNLGAAEGPNTPPAAAAPGDLNGLSGGAGGYPTTVPDDAGSGDTFAADAGVDPNVGETPNIAR